MVDGNATFDSDCNKAVPAGNNRYPIRMAHFDAPRNSPDETTPAEAAGNARAGLILFATYAVLYGGFMFVNAFMPQIMGITVRVAGGLNLALTWGLGLILVAFVLALFYAWICRSRSKPEGRP